MAVNKPIHITWYCASLAPETLSVKGGEDLKQMHTSRHCGHKIPVGDEIGWNSDFGQMGVSPIGEFR